MRVGLSMSNVTPVGDEIETTTDIEPLPQLPPLPRPTTRRWPLVVGLVVTVGYLVFAAYVANRLGILTMTANELGSFLSGIFAPLAFLWLVLGFLQQGEELRNSANALYIQGEELRAAVNQQRAMVALTKEQNDHIRRRDLDMEADEVRRAQPRFKPAPRGTTPARAAPARTYSFAFVNTGKPCTDVRVRLGDAVVSTLALLETGERIDWHFDYKEGDFDQLAGKIEFINSLGHDGAVEFSVAPEAKWMFLRLADEEVSSEIYK